MPVTKSTKADVFGIVYRLKRVESEHNHLKDSEGNGGNYGMFVHDDPAIYLDNSISVTKEQEVIAHELTHAIEQHFGFDLPENIIDSFGRGWLYIIKKNKSLIKYLQEEEKE